MNNLNEVVLEPSTNTHKLTSTGSVTSKKFGDSTIKMVIAGEGIVSHGEHGTLKTESQHVIKYNQQELNPVTRKLQNAFD